MVCGGLRWFAVIRRSRILHSVCGSLMLAVSLITHAIEVLSPPFQETIFVYEKCGSTSWFQRSLAINRSQCIKITGVIQKVLPVLSTETLLHISLSTEYYGFRPSSTAVDTGDTRGLMMSN